MSVSTTTLLLLRSDLEHSGQEFDEKSQTRRKNHDKDDGEYDATNYPDIPVCVDFTFFFS
jgi:hypothetical protein